MGCQKTLCAGVAAGKRLYHTQNSIHLDQNINLNKHKLSFLDNAILRNVMFLYIKTNYHETIHDGAIGIKGTIYDSAIGMKSRLVGHCFLTQAKNHVSD